MSENIHDHSFSEKRRQRKLFQRRQKDGKTKNRKTKTLIKKAKKISGKAKRQEDETYLEESKNAYLMIWRNYYPKHFQRIAR